MTAPKRSAWLLLPLLALSLASCGGLNEKKPAGTGYVTVSLTDAPSYAFDNVWVTVRQVWFHKVDTAPFDNTASGWVRFRLDNCATVNLAALPGDNNLARVFDNLALPAAKYAQMLLFLEPTEGALARSARDAGLSFNNQVDAGTLRAALRVPNAAQGIRVADRAFQVDNGALLRLAIDFDIGRDVLPFNRGAVREFLLQPRPRSFDLGNAGAIVGYIDNVAAADNAALFEVMAEQVTTVSGVQAHVVRRTAAVDNATGKFVLYPLDPGNIPGQLYDIVIRGIDRRTAIVRSVPVNPGSTPASGATALGTAASPIPMTPQSPPPPDFRIGAAIVPTKGALAKFYQILGTDPAYVIRQANFDPLTGTIVDFPLGAGRPGVDNFNTARYNGGSITLSPTPPSNGDGSYLLTAEALLFDPSAPPAGGILVNFSTVFNPVTIPALGPTVAPALQLVRVTTNLPSTVGGLDNVILFATYGGTILNAQPLGSMAAGTQIANSISNLPGGTGGAAFPAAIYGVGAYGWRTSADNVLRLGAAPGVADLRTGNTAVTATMADVTGP